MFVGIAARDRLALLQGGADGFGEPGLDAEVEEHGGEHRHDDRRGDRDNAEQQHQAHMQPGAGGGAAAFHPDAGEADGKQREQQQHDDEIGQDEREDLVRPLQPVGQQREGADPQHKGDGGQDQRGDAAHQQLGRARQPCPQVQSSRTCPGRQERGGIHHAVRRRRG